MQNSEHEKENEPTDKQRSLHCFRLSMKIVQIRWRLRHLQNGIQFILSENYSNTK